MGVFLSISNAASEPNSLQKLYRFTSDENEIVIDPADFHTFLKAFRGLQWKKEDSQIELRNIVLEWKSRLRYNEETQNVRSQAYDLIEVIENLHDEQDAILESENKKLELLKREETWRHNRGHEGTRRPLRDEDDEMFVNNDEGEFDELRREISRRQQYLQVLNEQSTNILKLALVDIEACQKMVEFSKDFKENQSDIESTTDERN